MKQYNEMSNVGKVKYLVNYHDGIKKHGDNSNFYDIAMFKNKVKKQIFINELTQKGYAYGNK